MVYELYIQEQRTNTICFRIESPSLEKAKEMAWAMERRGNCYIHSERKEKQLYEGQPQEV